MVSKRPKIGGKMSVGKKANIRDQPKGICSWFRDQAKIDARSCRIDLSMHNRTFYVKKMYLLIGLVDPISDVHN
jgi:hypothetical protein